MGSMLDLIGSAILFGVLILAVGTVQGNLNSTLTQNTFSVTTQGEAVNLARVIEYEVVKAGYGVLGKKVFVADSTSLAFLGAMTYGGAVDSISFSLGAPDTTTANPNDYRFISYARSSGTQSQRIVMTDFRITYFDTTHTKMTTPITGAGLSAIRGIDIRFRVESPEPVVDPLTGKSEFTAITWEKLIYPRNLGRPF